jgi:hypothetical protein
MSTYPDRLTEAMAQAGYDITRLAKELGISYVAVQKAAQKGAFGSLNNLKAAKILKVNHHWLATGEGERVLNDPFANPQPPQTNIHQIREPSRYFGKARVMEAIKVLEALEHDDLIEAVGWLKGFASRGVQKNDADGLQNLPIPAALGAGG